MDTKHYSNISIILLLQKEEEVHVHCQTETKKFCQRTHKKKIQNIRWSEYKQLITSNYENTTI